MERKRGWFLTIAAVLFALLALSNFLKPILADSHTGFVFFGRPAMDTKSLLLTVTATQSIYLRRSIRLISASTPWRR